jgi:hypothetical protein
MTKPAFKKTCGIAGILGLWLIHAHPAMAVCNNPNNWLQAPGADTKLFIGYEQYKSGFGETDVHSSEKYMVYPDPLPREMLDKAEPNQLPEGSGDITYYEPDGKKNWRICREDSWVSDGRLEGSLNKSKAQKLSARYRAGNSTLSKLSQSYWLASSKQYFYDAKGRLEHISVWYFEDEDTSSKIRICRHYDEKDRVILLLAPKTSQSCTANPPGLYDEWLRFRYGKQQDTDIDFGDQPADEEVELLSEWHRSIGKAWGKDISRFTAGTGDQKVHGAAKANETNGVTEIYGSTLGKLDNNAANTVLGADGRWWGSTYVFTKPPVPLAVLEKPELIYQYERRRQTYVDGNYTKLYEWFKPNEHISRHRYYSFDGDLLRHEQLNAQGRVTRVITLDNNWHQPRPGPHPDVDDKLLTDKGLSLHGHQIYHRVYDIDANGKPKLVAISWNRRFRINPLKKTHMDFAEVVYGTPNGKERWKQKEFEKIFDTSDLAAQVFPDK